MLNYLWVALVFPVLSFAIPNSYPIPVNYSASYNFINKNKCLLIVTEQRNKADFTSSEKSYGIYTNGACPAAYAEYDKSENMPLQIAINSIDKIANKNESTIDFLRLIHPDSIYFSGSSNILQNRQSYPGVIRSVNNNAQLKLNKSPVCIVNVEVDLGTSKRLMGLIFQKSDCATYTQNINANVDFEFDKMAYLTSDIGYFIKAASGARPVVAYTGQLIK